MHVTFIDASKASNLILSCGVDGIVGLGFTKLSGIDGALTKAGMTDGKSLLYNLFADNPKEPNFIAFSLQRTSEVSGDVEGSFTIGASPTFRGLSLLFILSSYRRIRRGVCCRTEQLQDLHLPGEQPDSVDCPPRCPSPGQQRQLSHVDQLCVWCPFGQGCRYA